MKHLYIFSSILRQRLCFKSKLNSFRFTSNVTEVHNKLENLFFKKEIQQILMKITGIDHDKIFAPSRTRIATPKYQFVTDKKLKELQERASLKAYDKIQMPPVMSVREPINEVLATDPELQGYLKHKTIFTDISTNVSNRDRLITVREVDGTLRKATWEERQRMNQVYFPIPGRHLEPPKLFETDNIQRLLNEGEYEFVLDCACAQFEPDAPEYHQVTSQTYEHLRVSKQFNVLRSTRHFGPMAFYFVYNKNIDTLLLDMISRQLLSDAADTIKLLYIAHPSLEMSKNVNAQDDLSVVQDYVQNHSNQKDDLEMAIQTFKEQQQAEPQAATV